MNAEGKVKITVRLPADMVMAMRLHAIARDVDDQQIVADALQAYLDEHDEDIDRLFEYVGVPRPVAR